MKGKINQSKLTMQMIFLFYKRDGQTVASTTHTSTGCLTGLHLAFRWKNRFNLTESLTVFLSLFPSGVLMTR